MYVSSQRYLSREYFRGSGITGSGISRNVRFSTPNLVEGVYSWRTGARATSDPAVPSSQRIAEFDGWGIRTPPKRGNLTDRLSERKRYLEEVQRAAFPAETQSGLASVNRTSSTDSGHLFASHKTFRNCYRGTMNYADIFDPSKGWNGDVWGSAGMGIQNPSGFPLLSGEDTGNLIGVSSTQRQGLANRLFAATAPDKSMASVGTTLVELLRGDIPSLLRNFQRMEKGYRGAVKYLGSEHLNVAFGWTPLIQEYANIIKVGMSLERVVYYESFRRRRRWDGPSSSGSSSPNVTLSGLNSPFGDTTYPYPGEVIGLNSGYGATFRTQHRWVASEDYHFSSKYVGMAKPSRRANSFTDQVNDVALKLGLVEDPQMLWELTPYSWLVDWFSTMGASIANSNLYSPRVGKYNSDYAYLTTQYSVRTDGTIVGAGSTNAVTAATRVTRGTAYAYSRTRWRDRATPFGFGTQLGSLSASQFGILVALGFAQSR